MKIQLRKHTFETNSSSSHTFVMCMDTEYEAFQNGDRVFDICEEELITLDEAYERYAKNLNGDYEYDVDDMPDVEITKEDLINYCHLENIDITLSPQFEKIYKFMMYEWTIVSANMYDDFVNEVEYLGEDIYQEFNNVVVFGWTTIG